MDEQPPAARVVDTPGRILHVLEWLQAVFFRSQPSEVYLSQCHSSLETPSNPGTHGTSLRGGKGGAYAPCWAHLTRRPMLLISHDPPGHQDPRSVLVTTDMSSGAIPSTMNAGKTHSPSGAIRPTPSFAARSCPAIRAARRSRADSDRSRSATGAPAPAANERTCPIEASDTIVRPSRLAVRCTSC